MKSIKVSIFGKYYPLKVEDHEEENMVRICKFVDERFQTYRNELVKQSEFTVMVLAALSIAEELFEARQHISDAIKDEEVIMKRVNTKLEKLIEGIKD
jgi:cell division protein ZapA